MSSNNEDITLFILNFLLYQLNADLLEMAYPSLLQANLDQCLSMVMIQKCFMPWVLQNNFCKRILQK